ncbi:hypothetical protein JMUB6875_42080 [Nocardia sp. JMUB6875]
MATPDIMMARLGSNPISTGATKLAPNMATTCCAPSPNVRGHDNRSSGRTTAPGAGVLPSPCTVQRTPNTINRPLSPVGPNPIADILIRANPQLPRPRDRATDRSPANPTDSGQRSRRRERRPPQTMP